MLKLDTHSIQMIAICTILISTIFLGYLEFKRLHYKLDSISNNLKTIEDSNTINKSLKQGTNNKINMTNPLSKNIQLSMDELPKEASVQKEMNSKEEDKSPSKNLVDQIFSSNKPIEQTKIINHFPNLIF